MRLCFVLPYVPSLIRVRPYHLVRELARRHEIWVLASGSRQEIESAEGLRTVCHRVEVVPTNLGQSLKSCALGALRGEPLQATVCRSPSFERRLAAMLSEAPFDLVHVEHLRAAHVRSGIPNSLPAVLDTVDCISLLLRRTLQFSHSPTQRLLARLELGRVRTYEARLFDRFDHLTVTSPEDAQALRALTTHGRLSVLPNGVDLDYFRPFEGPHEPATLVISGKMSYHANVTAVLYFVQQILPLIRRSHPEVRLRIVGSNPPAKLRELARDDAISVTGYLPDIRAALGTATIALCPVTVKVGVQNKLLEAMACGLPVVSTGAGLEGLAAQAGRDLLVADEPAEFAAQVGRLLADGALRSQLGCAGRRYVEAHHRWDVAARQLETIYAETVAQRRIPPSS